MLPVLASPHTEEILETVCMVREYIETIFLCRLPLPIVHAVVVVNGEPKVWFCELSL